MMQSSAWEQLSAGILPTMIWCAMNQPKESHRLNLQQEFRYYSELSQQKISSRRLRVPEVRREIKDMTVHCQPSKW